MLRYLLFTQVKDKNSKRVHDIFYAKEDHFTNPKEYFKEAINLIKKNTDIFDDYREGSFMDVGCAAGDFLRYFESNLEKKSKIKLYGIDIMDELLNEAKKRVPNSTFKKFDIGYTRDNLENIHNKKYDLITMFGVSCIFDDFIWLDNLFTGIKDDGFILLYGIFNPYPYDVILRVKKSNSDKWEPGWNVISKDSIISYVQKKNFQAKFIDFEPNISIKPDPNDGLRTWTLDLKDNPKDIANKPVEQKRKRLFTSANRVIHDWSFCLIRK